MNFPQRPRILPFLNLVKLLLVLIMVIMFIQFNAKIAQQQAVTKEIAQSTNNVVKSQDDILKAIKEVTDDTHSTAAQQTAIIICMLQVPVNERTTDLQAQCRSNAAKNDSASQTDGSAASNPYPSKTPTSQSSSASASNTSPSSSGGSSSSNNSNTQTPQSQQSFSQCVASKSSVLGKVIGVITCL